MLCPVLTLAICVGMALSASVPAYTGYHQSQPVSSYDHGPIKRDYVGYYFGELAEARSRIVALGENDLIIDNRLDKVKVKVDFVTDFRKKFYDSVLPAVKQDMAEQDAKVKSISEQLKALSVLLDETEALKVQVEHLVSDLKEVRSNRLTVDTDLDRLVNSDIVHNQLVGQLEAQVKFQDGRLTEVGEIVSGNELKTQESTNVSKAMATVVSNERAEVFTVSLSQDDKSVYQTFAAPFPEVPKVSWGIVKLLISEDKRAGYEKVEEAINTYVNVVPDPSGLNITLSDESSLWSVDKLVVKVSAFYVDNEEVKFKSSVSHKG